MKYFFILNGLMAMYLIILAVIDAIKGKKFNHFNAYVSIINLIVFYGNQ
jgi:hypothetical protein